MTVLKGTDLLDSPQLLLQSLDILEDLIASGGRRGFALLRGQGSEFAVDGLGFGEGVEEAGKEGALLARDLGGWGVVGDGTVTDGPDVLSTVDDEVFVYGEAAAGVLLRRYLGHEVLDDGADGVTGGPDEEAVGEGFELFGPVRFCEFGFNVFVGNSLDHSLCANGNRFFFEGGFGVVDELLGEHGQDVRKGFDKRDMEIVSDFRDPFLEVLLEEVLELASEFDTGGTTAHDDHVEEAFTLLRRLIFEAGRFDTVHDALADLLGVANFLQETRMFADTGYAKGCVFSTATYNEHVERDFGRGRVSFDFGFIVDVDNLALIVDLGGFGLVVFNGGFLVAEDVSYGFHDGSMFDRAGCT